MTGAAPGYGVYRTADERYLAIGAIESKFWRRLCHALNLPALADLALTTVDEALHAREALAEAIKAQPLAHWEATLVPLDCCVTPVLRLDEAVQHPQFVARQATLPTDNIIQGAPPFKLSHWPSQVMQPARSAGADSDSILQSIGYAAKELELLRAAGVI